MKKVFKKITASIVAVTSLVVGMVGMSASAISDTVTFYKAAGAPGSATYVSESWNYTIALYTSAIDVSNFSATNSSTKIYAYISLNGKTKAAGFIYPSSGSVTANDMDLGESGYASADVINVDGNIRATVSVSG